MRGRKPKPSALHVLNGNPGKRARNADEPHPAVIAMDPPTWLEPEAMIRWQAIAPELEAIGCLTVVDGDALAAYCQVWARWKKAEEAIVQFGQVIKTPKGYPVQSPYIGIANKALSHVRAFESEFGMTPSSRSRVHVKGSSSKSQAQRFMDTRPKLRAVK